MVQDSVGAPKATNTKNKKSTNTRIHHSGSRARDQGSPKNRSLWNPCVYVVLWAHIVPDFRLWTRHLRPQWAQWSLQLFWCRSWEFAVSFRFVEAHVDCMSRELGTRFEINNSGIERRVPWLQCSGTSCAATSRRFAGAGRPRLRDSTLLIFVTYLDKTAANAGMQAIEVLPMQRAPAPLRCDAHGARRAGVRRRAGEPQREPEVIPDPKSSVLVLFLCVGAMILHSFGVLGL